MTFRLAEHGRAFATRPRGVELLGALESQARPGDLAIIDFTGVLSVSYSFADEFVGRLLERQAQGELPFAVRLTNISPGLQRVIARCLDSRGVAHAEMLALA